MSSLVCWSGLSASGQVGGATCDIHVYVKGVHVMYMSKAFANEYRYDRKIINNYLAKVLSIECKNRVKVENFKDI